MKLLFSCCSLGNRGQETRQNLFPSSLQLPAPGSVEIYNNGWVWATCIACNCGYFSFSCAIMWFQLQANYSRLCELSPWWSRCALLRRAGEGGQELRDGWQVAGSLLWQRERQLQTLLGSRLEYDAFSISSMDQPLHSETEGHRVWTWWDFQIVLGFSIHRITGVCMVQKS